MDLVGFDLETSNLKPWDGEIYSMAAWDTQGITMRMPTKDQLAKWLNDTAEKKQTIVGWNVMFDIAWLLAYGLGEEVRKNKWLDAMLLLKRIDGWRHSYGLKEQVAEKWPQYANYAINDFSKPETEEEWIKWLQYNLSDSVFTLTLAKDYIAHLSKKELHMAQIEANTLTELAQSWLDGIHIDEAALQKLKEENIAQMMALRLELGVSSSVLASPKQLANLLYDQWKLPVPRHTDKGARSTSKEALHILALQNPNDPRLKKLLEMRKCNTVKGKYVEAVEKSIKLHGRPITHPQPQAGGTYTSRLTYSSKQGKNKDTEQTGIALHQWSRDKRVRAELKAPEGYLLGEWDFSGQEMRLMADASLDNTMLSLFLDGIDGHSYMGGSIKGIPWDYVHQNYELDPEIKHVRNLGKFANLSLQYRIGIDTMKIRALTQYGLNLSDGEAYLIKSKYLSTYPGVVTYWSNAIKMAYDNGYAETRGGHRIVLNDLSDYGQQQTAINFRIQGTGGDMKLLALSVLKNHLAQMGAYFAWDLHDALFLYLKDDEKAVKNAHFVQNLLSNLPYETEWGWHPAVPMPVDGKLGKSWGTLKGYE